MLRVMPQLPLDVGDLGVKLILLGRLRGVEASIERLAFHVVGLGRDYSKKTIRPSLGFLYALSSESSHDIRPPTSLPLEPSPSSHWALPPVPTTRLHAPDAAFHAGARYALRCPRRAYRSSA